MDGAAGAVEVLGKAFWAVFGAAILAGLYYVAQLVVAHGPLKGG